MMAFLIQIFAFCHISDVLSYAEATNSSSTTTTDAGQCQLSFYINYVV